MARVAVIINKIPPEDSSLKKLLRKGGVVTGLWFDILSIFFMHVKVCVY